MFGGKIYLRILSMTLIILIQNFLYIIIVIINNITIIHHTVFDRYSPFLHTVNYATSYSHAIKILNLVTV